MTSKDKKGFFKEWLETLQQESWQLELLISGLALFGVFSSKELVENFGHFIDIQFFSGVSRFILNLFYFILSGAWYIFVINLVIHIILRGLWIGAIGLRYVSEDIDYDKLNLSDYFIKLFTRRYKSFDDYIEELERLCSVIFAYTFLLFFLLISASLYLMWPALIMAIMPSTEVGMFIIFIYVLLSLFVFVDFIFLNPIKKIKDKTISKVYGFIFRFYSTITLSFLFRPILLNFLDNRFTKRLFIFSIPYAILIILVFPRIVADSHSFFPQWEQKSIKFRAYNSASFNPYLYDNLSANKEKQRIQHFSIESDVVKSNMLKFFVTLKSSDQSYLENEKGYSKLHKVGFFTSFNDLSTKDEEIKELESMQNEELIKILNLQNSDKNNIGAVYWQIKKDSLESAYENKAKIYYKNKLSSITKDILDLSNFYINESIVSEKVNCFFAEHPNLGERGWNCFLPLDTLSNGVHSFKFERGYYSTRNKTVSTFELEIPFILDR